MGEFFGGQNLGHFVSPKGLFEAFVPRETKHR